MASPVFGTARCTVVAVFEPMEWREDCLYLFGRRPGLSSSMVQTVTPSRSRTAIQICGRSDDGVGNIRFSVDRAGPGRPAPDVRRSPAGTRVEPPDYADAARSLPRHPRDRRFAAGSSHRLTPAHRSEAGRSSVYVRCRNGLGHGRGSRSGPRRRRRPVSAPAGRAMAAIISVRLRRQTSRRWRSSPPLRSNLVR
jgi:hypothetical protein